MNRNTIVLDALSPARRAAALQEHARLRQFCTLHGLTVGPEAIALYLTDRARDGTQSGQALRSRLGLLDIMARVDGHPPWSRDPDLRLFTRGLFKTAPLARSRHLDPLYRETVHALVDAIDQPHPDQIRQVALICLAHHARIRVSALFALQWSDVQLRAGGVRLRVQIWGGRRTTSLHVPGTGGPTCPVTVLRNLRQVQTRAVGPVFDCHQAHMYQTLKAAGFTNGWTHRPPLDEDSLRAHCARIMAPTERQSRDRALILIAFAADLSIREMLILRRDHIETVPQGLILRIPNRWAPTGIPKDPQQKYCPVHAWQRWEYVRAQQPDTLHHPAAFLQIEHEHRLLPRGMTRRALNFALHEANQSAGFSNRWGFGGIREGAIRTAARSHTPTLVIAEEAGLRYLGSVQRHQHRESLITSSVANELGL